MSKPRTRTSLLVVALVHGIAACGSGSGADGLRIEPPDAELLIKDGVPATQTFTATLTDIDGTTRDVTSEVSFNIDGKLGVFNANTVTISIAGKMAAYATLDDDVVTVPITVRL